MTLSDIKTLLAGIDPNVRHYFSEATGASYTFWEETQRLPYLADDVHQEGWEFYVHRFTKDEEDEVAAEIFSALDEDPRTTVIHRVDFEPDTGYIHHIFQCEGF